MEKERDFLVKKLEKYIKDNGIKNIRNLTAGSVRQLDNSVTKRKKNQVHCFGRPFVELDGN